jgi:hypothetical protein
VGSPVARAIPGNGPRNIQTNVRGSVPRQGSVQADGALNRSPVQSVVGVAGSFPWEEATVHTSDQPSPKDEWNRPSIDSIARNLAPLF